jgi:transcriptional regulator with XRE-family HTH domain
VARQCGISTAQYNHYLNGKREPNLDILRRICQVLGIAADHLIDGPALFFGDALTGRAMANLSEAARDLTKDELDLLADVAHCAQARRKRDDFVLYTPDARWEILARVHERLIPAFIRLYRPREFSTVLVHGHTERLTSVELTAELEGVKQPRVVEDGLRALIKDCLGVEKDRVRVQVHHTRKQTTHATCAITAK